MKSEPKWIRNWITISIQLIFTWILELYKYENQNQKKNQKWNPIFYLMSFSLFNSRFTK